MTRYSREILTNFNGKNLTDSSADDVFDSFYDIILLLIGCFPKQLALKVIIKSTLKINVVNGLITIALS